MTGAVPPLLPSVPATPLQRAPPLLPALSPASAFPGGQRSPSRVPQPSPRMPPLLPTPGRPPAAPPPLPPLPRSESAQSLLPTPGCFVVAPPCLPRSESMPSLWIGDASDVPSTIADAAGSSVGDGNGMSRSSSYLSFATATPRRDNPSFFLGQSPSCTFTHKAPCASSSPGIAGGGCSDPSVQHASPSAAAGSPYSQRTTLSAINAAASVLVAGGDLQLANLAAMAHFMAADEGARADTLAELSAKATESGSGNGHCQPPQPPPPSQPQPPHVMRQQLQLQHLHLQQQQLPHLPQPYRQAWRGHRGAGTWQRRLDDGAGLPPVGWPTQTGVAAVSARPSPLRPDLEKHQGFSL